MLGGNVALTNTIIMGTFNWNICEGSIIKVCQSGTSYIPTSQRKQDTSTLFPVTKAMFVWDGNVFIPSGTWRGTSWGYAAYNPVTNKMCGDYQIYTAALQSRIISMGKYLLISDASNFVRMSSPCKVDLIIGASAVSLVDYVILGNTVYATNPGTATYTINYPFTAIPSVVAGNITRLCVFNGVVYGLRVTAGICNLYQYAAGAWAAIGAGFTPTESGDIQATAGTSTQTCFFVYNNKLWALFCYNTPGTATQWVRCYEVDVVTGGATEQNALVPALWKVVPNHGNCHLFEIIDDTSTTRKVYIVRAGNQNAGVWEMCEFSDSVAWPLVANGADIIFPMCGLVYDEHGHQSQIESSSDSVPSSYSTIVIRTSDLSANGPVDIDPRYDNLTTPNAPPHLVCTEKNGVGSEGKTGLSSKPAGVTTIADLSDDFADSVIDSDLWEPCNPSYNESVSYDSGLFGQFVSQSHALSETAGRIAFGGLAPAPVTPAGSGVGIASKWWIIGDFQIDAIISVANLANSAAARTHRLFIKVFEEDNKCYGIQVHSNVGVYKANGFTYRPDTNALATNLSADSAAFADGIVLRVSRTGSVWALRVDPSGANLDVLPTDLPLYSGPVRFVLGACTRAASNFASGTPGPGFLDVTVSGTGSLGLYCGHVTHNFMWDHITDLGAGFNGVAQLYTDS